VTDQSSLFDVQQLAARFANSFDIKDRKGLKDCLSDSIYVDYSELRGGTPEASLVRNT